MQNIFNNWDSFLKLLLIIGIFLLIAGLGIVNIESITIAPGETTINIGVLLIIISLFGIFIPKIKKQSKITILVPIVGFIFIALFLFWIVTTNNKKNDNSTSQVKNNYSITNIKKNDDYKKIVTNNKKDDNVKNIKKYQDIYRENFTKSKKGLLSIDKDWKYSWENYFTKYNKRVKIQTKDVHYILNSPNLNDVYRTKKDNFIEVLGYIRTNQGVFYVTEYSYKNRNKKSFPKFISLNK